METGPSGNAMTEIALALAMGFFSIMVLTMVSMGAGTGTASEIVAAALTPPAADAEASARTETQAEDFVVLYHEGRFLGVDLEPLAIADLPSGRRVVLALDPALPMAEAMRVRAMLPSENLIVSTLDGRWLAALGKEQQ